MLFNRFDISEQALPKSKRSERVTIEMSRYDLEIIMRSLEESYFSELSKTTWINLTPDTYPPQYGYKGNNITNRLKSTLAYIKKQTLKS